MSEFVGIPADQVDAVWREVEPLVNKALDNDCRAVDIYRALVKGEMNLCLSVDEGEIEAACVSEIQQHPRSRVWFIRYLGGHGMTNWLPFEEYVTVAARNAGCRKIRTWGRDGWERVSGWKKTRVVLEKDL